LLLVFNLFFFLDQDLILVIKSERIIVQMNF